MQFLDLVPIVAVAAPVVAFLVDLLKQFFPKIRGYSGLLASGLNLLFWIGMVVAEQTGHVSEATTVIEAIGTIAPVVMAVIASFAASKGTHKLTKWTGTFPERKGIGH
jgi:hypothetical protein